MALDTGRVRSLLKQADLKKLFIEELGWDHGGSALALTVDGQPYTLIPIAQKRGMVAYRCSPTGSGAVPAYAQRHKIHKQTAKHTREHLIIYLDAAATTQHWQWFRYETGRPAACREHIYTTNQSGEALAQKLGSITFTLAEEEKLTLPDVTGRAHKAFDADKVTKKFYDRFTKEHARFVASVGGITAEADRAWYASVMLNRLMFVYFVQKKGFLADDTSYLRNRMRMVREKRGNGHFLTFYRAFLLRLFHEGLGGQDRTPELTALIGQVPYLNGGLFAKHAIEERYAGIDIPDEAFEAVFDFFDAYHWHLEDRPLRNDSEINPDVLGYIFEKYINQKELGAYYTKEDITEYIGRSTIVPYLLDRARDECRIAFASEGVAWGLLRDTPDRYIFEPVRRGVVSEDGAVHAEAALPEFVQAGMHDPKARMFDKRYNLGAADIRAADGRQLALPTETWREYVDRRTRCLELRQKLATGDVHEIDDLVTLNLDARQFIQDVVETCEGPDLLRAVWQGVRQLRVLDPTVGSGAFLFAALNILEPIYDSCLDRMATFVADADAAPQSDGRPQFADFRETLAEVERHPNRAYYVLKSIMVNNLYGVDIVEEATEICKLRLFLKLVAQVDTVEHVEPLPDIDFNIRAGNTLVGYATIADIDRLWDAVESSGPGGQRAIVFEKDHSKLQQMVTEYGHLLRQFRDGQLGLPTPKVVTKADVDRARNLILPELDQDLWRLYREAGKVEQKTMLSAFQASHQPFHWFVEFPEVMAAGGFGVVIGNPPYVEFNKLRRAYSVMGYESGRANNLYAFCMERSCSVVPRSGARLGMIVPAGVVGLGEALETRQVLQRTLRSVWVSCYGIRPSKLFDGVDQRLCIYTGRSSDRAPVTLHSSRFLHWAAEARATLFGTLGFIDTEWHTLTGRIPKLCSANARSVLKRLDARSDRTVGDLLAPDAHGTTSVYYHRSPRYWVRGLNFRPHFRSATRTMSVHHLRELKLGSQADADIVLAILNSSLFFWWFLAIGNARNLTGEEVRVFPLGQAPTGFDQIAPRIEDLMADYVANSFTRLRADCEYQEFRIASSKPLLDAVDCALAEHYGLTDEELDFIVNYDIKYRMGKDAGEEE